MKKLYACILVVLLSSCQESDMAIPDLEKERDSLLYEIKELKSEMKSLKIAGKNEHITYTNESFDCFLWEFMTDSTFQKSRIKFPLSYITWKNADFNEIDTILIKNNEWKHDWFYAQTASERTQIYDNYNLKLQPTDERLLHWYGVETGGDVKYYFKGFQGKWYLIKKEQLGD